MTGLIGGLFAGFVIALAANLAGVVAREGLLPNGNPVNGYAMSMIVGIIVFSTISGWCFKS